MAKRTDRQKMIDKLDDLVRDRLKTEYPKVCVTCGKRLDWFHPHNNPLGLQVGHYISRDIKQLRWHPKNVAPQCSSCNWEHEKNPAPYSLWIIKTYGQETLEMLNEERRLAKAYVKPLKAWQLEELYKEQNKGGGLNAGKNS
jgi:hypothetical protein